VPFDGVWTDALVDEIIGFETYYEKARR